MKENIFLILDIAPPDIKCPDNYDVQLEDNDNFAIVTELRLPEVSGVFLKSVY